jgi:hypothetical protein
VDRLTRHVKRVAGDRWHAGGRSKRAVVDSLAGFRRVYWVRLIVDGDGKYVAAQAEGMANRCPSTRPIPLSAAGNLIALGTPFVTRTLSGPRTV